MSNRYVFVVKIKPSGLDRSLMGKDIVSLPPINKDMKIYCRDRSVVIYDVLRDYDD